MRFKKGLFCIQEAHIFWIECVQLLAAAQKCCQPFLEPLPESSPPVWSNIQSAEGGTQVYPGTGSAHCFHTMVHLHGLLWGRCEQQHPGGSHIQTHYTWVQVAHPVGVCQTPVVCSAWRHCGKMKSVLWKMLPWIYLMWNMSVALTGGFSFSACFRCCHLEY